MEEKTLFIGRQKEWATLQKAVESRESELVAVIGRRRVGKTFLIRSFFENDIDFELTGLQDGSLKDQLKHFHQQLMVFFGKNAPKKQPVDWLDAFFQLQLLLDKKVKTGKFIVFIDEISWISTPKSKFLAALGNFWNSWATRKSVIIVICGSAASWMIQKVVHHRGGLHNRITKRIDLQPFTIGETEQFFRSRNQFFERYQILQFYMAMGGIPHYLKEIEAGKSAVQNINDLCFEQGGLLNDEFSKLYSALFASAEKHILVVRALAQKWKGLTRAEVVANTKIPDGGGASDVLEELESCGFITSYYPFGKKKKELLYRLTDEYSLFYLHFIENQKLQGNQIWHQISQTQAYKSWSGVSFEHVCLKHLPQIKPALGISSVYSEASGFISRGNETEAGIQIDLVLDRKDQVINLFEIKFYTDAWIISKEEADNLREKISLFRRLTRTKKQLFLTTLTTFGVKNNQQSIGLVDQNLQMDVLFKDDF
jgi:uncharacterized protein